MGRVGGPHFTPQEDCVADLKEDSHANQDENIQRTLVLGAKGLVRQVESCEDLRAALGPGLEFALGV